MSNKAIRNGLFYLPEGSCIKLNLRDVDGNLYNSVIIGNQQWMLQNYKCTKYIDGTPIPNLTLDAEWSAENGTAGHNGAYCAYDNDNNNIEDYGLLYNNYCVDNPHGLAPFGWKLANYNDLQVLVAYLGGENVSGEKLRETGVTHWAVGNTGTNTSGFTAFGGGYRENTGAFVAIGEYGAFLGEANQFLGMEWNTAEATVTEFTPGYGMSVRMMRYI